ncbi:MAG: hypothetical protein KGL39_32450 [Patescibacteria group bacterium]|nr:hypothetical protein [Patescibacteria group bacterium]
MSGFISMLSDRLPIVNDSNIHTFCPGPGRAYVNGQPMSHGLIPRDRAKEPGYLYGLEAFGYDLIPESEWDDRLREQEKNKSSLTDLILEVGLPPLDQNGTSFCWANSSTMAAQILHVKEGQPKVHFSPASVACPINGFVNQGGWCGQSCKQIADHGVVPVEMWPANAISRQYYTEEMKKEAAKNRITKWFEGEHRNSKQLATCLLLGIPVAVDFNWWSHSVCAIRLVKTRNGYGTEIYNSWGTHYGDQGRAVIEWPKGIPDDMACPQVIMGRRAA